MPSTGRAASGATGRNGLKQWGKLFVITRFCIKTEMKQSTQKRERTRMKGKKREECVCVFVCVCLCTQVTNLTSKFKPGQDGRQPNRHCRPEH